ncbi:DNA/RNA non-specific endonuclease [Amycolatopsis japonica]|uniref:DNA/RNA non-specific endonuclease n=1 Tax=Amycolatopsis japonica TaxID=208439 RepID=UPI0033CB625F
MLAVLLPVAGSAVEYAKPAEPLPLGASLESPTQRPGTGPGSGRDERPGLEPRDTPRPPGAVADSAAAPPQVNGVVNGGQHVKPAVEQRSGLPAIDPKAVERPQDRTADTQTFDNPDGSRTLRVHTGQANVRDADGGWSPIDLNLQVGPDGRWAPRKAPTAVSFAPLANAGQVASAGLDGGHTLAYALRDAAPVPARPTADTVTYPGALPDVDLRLSATNGGLKEELVLHTPKARSSYEFTLHTGALRPQIVDGDVKLVDQAGVVRGVIPAGFMIDGKVDPATGTGVRSEGVRYSLAQSGSQAWTLRVDLDTAWLKDPSRVFPVVVDPSVGKVWVNEDTYVKSGTTQNHSGNIELEVGSANGGRTISRSYLKLEAVSAALRNQYIIGATLDVLAVYSCQTRPVTLFEVTQGWGNSAVWPGAAAGRALATVDVPALGAGCAGQHLTQFVLPQDIAIQWSHGTALGNGFTIRAANEGDSAAFKRFASANTPNKPYLDVRYAPEGAAYELTDVLLPTNTREGTFTAKVTNQGSSTWTAGGGYRLGYLVKQNGSVIKTSQGVAPGVDVPPGGQATITVPLTALAPGDYELLLTMWNPANEDFHVVYEVPYGSAPLKVQNTPPGSNYQQPGNGATVESLTPTLFARAVDDDNWPNKGFTFQFRICTDAALSQNCTDSPWGPESWVPPAGKLVWSKTYYWGVKTHDTVSPSPNWVGPLALATRVPQPEITSHLAGSPDTVNGPGLDPQIGNYSTVVTDANVATVGPDLTITRTYNSLDPRRDTAFGVGWASRLDTRLVPNRSAQNVVVDVLLTYPNGRQARFGRNPDGSFAPPMGQNVDLVYDSSTGYYTLRDVTGSRWLFDNAGKLIRITDPAGLTEHLEYDTSGHVTAVVNDVSGRSLGITWTGAHVTKVQTPPPAAGQEPLTWTYTYDGDTLTGVCAPGAAPNCTSYGRLAGSHYRSSVMDDGPRGYWRLGEDSGPTTANVAARTPGADAGKQNGLGFGAVGALGGTSDTAAVFDGMASYLTLPDDLLKENMSVSAELWFKTAGSGTLLSYADQAFPATAPAKWRPLLYVGIDGHLYGGLSARNVTGPSQVISTNPVNDNGWHHAVLTSEVDRQTLYLDGAAIGSISGLIDHGTLSKLVVGGGVGKNFPSTNGGDFYFNGSIDEVALYQHTLSPFAVAQHFGAARTIDQLTKITLPQDGRVFAEIGYDDRADRAKALTDHDGRKWTLDLPLRNNAERTVTLRGPYPDWTYKFDADQGGRITSVIHKGFDKHWEYNEKGFLKATVDELDNRAEQTTDERGNVLSRKTCRAVGSCNTSYFTYVTSSDPLDPRRDKVATSSDARSSSATDTRYRTSYAYDTAGRLTTTTFPIPAGQIAAPTEVRTYASGAETAEGGGKVPAGVLVQVTDRRNQVASNAFRANGDLAFTKDVMGLVTSYTYDGIGRRLSQQEGNIAGGVFGTRSFEYTPKSEIAKITGPATTNTITGVTHTPVTSNVYDGNGNLLEATVSDATGGDLARKTAFGYNAFDQRVSVNYPDGGVVQYERSPDLLKVVTTDVLGTKWTDQFDDERRLLSRVASGIGADPATSGMGSLRVENRSYDATGRLERVQDAMNRATRYGYYGDGLLATTTLEGYQPPDGPARDVLLEQRVYDPAGNLTQQVTAGNRKAVSAYDAAGFVTESTVDPDGVKRKTAFVRDGAGNPTRATSTGAADPSRIETTDFSYAPNGSVSRQDTTASTGLVLSSTTTYDERGLAVATTDRRQVQTRYTYDAAGHPVSTIKPAVDVWVDGQKTANVELTESLGHNTFGEVTQSKDSAGNVTTTERDNMGRATAGILPPYTPPGGQPITPVTRTVYDRGGNALTVTDHLNRTTTNTYDPYGHLLTSTLPQVGDTPSVLKSSYNGNGELLSSTDATGAREEYTYDEFGRRITTTQVERYGGQTAFYTARTGYDDAGNVISQTTPQGFVSTKSYNGANDLISETDATNRTVTYGYDNSGRQDSVTDPTGLVSKRTYDLAGRMTGTAQIIDGQPQRSSSSSYDGNGNVVQSVSPEGRTVDYGYDFLNRLVKQVEKVDATKSITTWTGYDRLGSRSHFVDGKGNATEYTYTPWGLPESVIEPAVAGATQPGDRSWTTTYDAVGRATKLVAPGGVTRTREYDDQDRLTTERGTGAEQTTTDRTFGYDLAGRATKVGGPGGDTHYRYDDRGNLRTSQGPMGSSVYTYNGDGTLATRADAAGTATFTYDAAGRLYSAADPITGRTVDYRYDNAGRLSLTKDRALSGRVTRNIGYDKLGRLASGNLTQLTDTSTRVVFGDSYGYDKDDKVTSKTSTRPGASATNAYGYDGVGRLTSWAAGAQQTSYGWDDAGNRSSVNGAAYTYNERNQLLSGGGAAYTYTKRGTVSAVTRGSTTTTSGFDAFDRLVTQGATSYQYDSKDRVHTRNNIALTYDGLSNESVTDGMRTVSRLPDGTALSDKAGADGKLLYADRHGDVVGRYLGAVVDGQRTFDPFGVVTASSGDASNLGYQGDWTSPDSGDVNMTARWYSPERGGFLSRDDRTLDPTPSMAANRYSYGNSDVIGTVDPDGHNPVAVGIGAVGIGWQIAGAVMVGAITYAAIDNCIRSCTLPWAGSRADAVARPITWSTTREEIADEAAWLRLQGRNPGLDGPPRGPGTGFGPKVGGGKGGGPRGPAGPRPTPPRPPPPPPWVSAALQQAAKLVAGQTVAKIVDAIDVVTQNTKVKEKGDEYSEEESRVTNVGPNSLIYRQYAEDYRSAPEGATRPGEKEKDYCGGWIAYSPLDELDRATGAMAKLCDPLVKGTKTDSKVFPKGYEGVDENGIPFDKAHLIAARFGGSGTMLENLIPGYRKAVNRSQMKRVENAVAEAVQKRKETVYFVVTPVYDEMGGNVPAYVRMFAIGSGGTCIDAIVSNIPRRETRYDGACG